jgi:hypothetical protein
MGIQPQDNRLEQGVHFLTDMGYEAVRARRALEVQKIGPGEEYDLESAINLLMSEENNSNKQLIVRNDAPPVGNQEDEMARVLVESLKNAAATGGKEDDLTKAMAASIKEKEDMEIKRALQMSMAAHNNSGPQPMEVDLTGQPKMSDEDRAMAEAIEKSLESSVSAGVSVNPSSMKRDAGVPVGLKNVGNTYPFVLSLLLFLLSFPSRLPFLSISLRVSLIPS